MNDVIYIPNSAGTGAERFELCIDGLYHWHGFKNYPGYTKEELENRL